MTLLWLNPVDVRLYALATTYYPDPVQTMTDHQSHNDAEKVDSMLPSSDSNKRTNQDGSYDSTVATKRVRVSPNSQLEDSGTSHSDRSGSSLQTSDSMEQSRGLETFRQQIQRLSSQNKSFENQLACMRSIPYDEIDDVYVQILVLIIESLKSLIVIEHGRNNAPPFLLNHFWMNADTSKPWPYHDDAILKEMARSKDIEKFIWGCIDSK